tara:strand:- start:122 stop:514 length:393 start_codon:yes stop_codon:yes gene_type:complete
MTIPNLKGQTWLIVHHDSSSRKLYGGYISRAGATVITANDRTSGLETLANQETKVDGVVTDLFPRYTNGTEMLRAYLATNPNPTPAIVGISSNYKTSKTQNHLGIVEAIKDGKSGTFYQAINQALAQKQQ